MSAVIYDMKFRKLRITWTICCGIACVLLCVLWMRSYWWADELCWVVSEQEHGGFSVCCGRIIVREQHFRNYIDSFADYSPHLSLGTYPSDSQIDLDDSWFGYTNNWGITRLHFPILIPLVLTALISYFTWTRLIQVRFTTRTLLIATTLVAVVLGVAVYLSTRPPAGPRFDQGFGR
jgi:hypothetical protein